MDFLLFYAVSCPPLMLENGDADYSTDILYDDHSLRYGYSVGTNASLSCDQFYDRHGSSSVLCQSSGNWSDSIPICNASNDN